MKKEKTTQKVYSKPEIKSEAELPELPMNCMSTNKKYCGTPYTPKKG
jgi:hypothetical protein